MMARVRLSTSLIAAVWASGLLASTVAADILPRSALEALGGQRYWEMHLPLADSERVARIALLDDNLYVLTDRNRVYAVHSRTGIIRWGAPVADPGVTVRGPSHAERYVYFTTPGAVRVFDRRTGELASEPRTLRGVIIDVAHDVATVTIGQVHGVRNGDILGVYRLNEVGELEEEPIAQLRITWIDSDRSKGRLIQYDRRDRPRSGDRVRAKVTLPLEKVELPFAASSAAVGDDIRIFVGAANQRFYSLDIHSGFRHWQLLTPKTVSARPVLHGEDLYIAGHDGRVISCTKNQRERNWIYQTDGPIFADIVIDGERLYVASGDRSLYCLDRLAEGSRRRRIWRERFEAPLMDAPAVSDGRVYQLVPRHGLFVLDAKTGEHLWEREEGGRFLVQFGDDVYLLAGDGPSRLVRLDAKTGTEKAGVSAGPVAFAAGSQEDQSILLVTRTGESMCVRSKKAPRLRPSQLAEVLRDDRKIEVQRELDARRRAEAQAKRVARTDVKKPRRYEWVEVDWLRSRKTGRPVGGHGLVDVEGGEVASDTEEDELDEDEDEGEDEDDEDDEDYEDDEDLDEDDEALDDDEDLDEDDEAFDDEDEDDEDDEDADLDDEDEEDDDEEDDEDLGDEDEDDEDDD